MKEATRERVLRIAKDLDYQPDLAAKGLRMRKSFLIGAVFPYLNISFFNRTIGGIEKRCFENGYDILIASPPPEEIEGLSGTSGSRSIDRLVARKVDGIIATPAVNAYAHYRRIIDAGIPFLQVMTRIPGFPAPFIGVDNRQGGRLAARHLIELGHRAIGFLKSSSAHYEEVEQRYGGYLEALVEAGIRLDPERVCVEAGTLNAVEEARASTRILLARAPELTAIFAPTDYAALGAIGACRDLGLLVPEDISVIGYDDIEIASFQIEHPLSTIAQPKEELGGAAFDMLLDLMRGEKVEDRLVAPSLVVRSTTGRARA